MKSAGLGTFILSLALTGPLIAASGTDSFEKILGPALEGMGITQIYEVPRADLNVLVSGIPLDPGMSLINRFEFTQEDQKFHLSGRLVLIDGEIPKELEVLAKHHWKVNGLSHLLLGESPSLKCLQFRALGPSTELAEGVEELLGVMGRSTWSLTPVSSVVPDPEFQKQAESLFTNGRWKGPVLRLDLEASSNTVTANSKEPEDPPSGTLYLQAINHGALLIGDLFLSSEEAVKFYPSLQENQLNLISWVRESTGGSGTVCRLRFMGRGSLEDLAKSWGALQDQWKVLFAGD